MDNGQLIVFILSMLGKGAQDYVVMFNMKLCPRPKKLSLRAILENNVNKWASAHPVRL